MGFLKRLVQDTDGNAIAIGAVLFIPVVALIGAGLDISVAYTTQAKLQNACDAAVLAGRQSMDGGTFANNDRTEAENYFEFNFPDGTHNSRNVVFEIEQDEDDNLELVASASAEQPTAMMQIFGYDAIPVSVECTARRDQFDSDIVLVLDVTGSMAQSPSGGGDAKIELLRDGANGLYRALEGDNLGTIRYGFVPYSHTVNPARSLRNRDIMREQTYVSNSGGTKDVHINESQWNIGNGGGNTGGNTQNFRTSGDGCIEERPSIGENHDPAEYSDSITLWDVDSTPANANDRDLQFGRYDPLAHDRRGAGTSQGIQFYYIYDRWVQTGCPSESKTLAEYSSEDSFSDAVDEATARVTGGTYHDIGMLWGLRFISRNGFFASDNPATRNGIAVNQHIIFMTDGKLDTGANLYSAYGIDGIQDRANGGWTLDDFHLSRFESACNLAKSMGVTVWVIALDVTDIDDIRPCATTDENFYTSDGSDLEEVFTEIGNGIGYLRLTK